MKIEMKVMKIKIKRLVHRKRAQRRGEYSMREHMEDGVIERMVEEKRSTHHRHTTIEQIERYVPRKGRQETRDEGLSDDTEGASA